MIEQAGIRTMINGPIPYSADADFVMGKVPELDNYYVATGFLYGIAAGGGAGKMMAEWILEGRPSLDLWPLDVRRFAFHHTTHHFMGSRMVELYAPPLQAGGPGHRAHHVAWREAQPVARFAGGAGRGVRIARRLGAAQLVRTARRRAGRPTVVRRAELVPRTSPTSTAPFASASP